MIYSGLDVSLNSVAVCAVDETGKLIREGTTLADAPSIVQYSNRGLVKLNGWALKQDGYQNG
ncbi:hypothetical protein [Bradyrhizobium sp. Gha]|uniref:hypothetical protein n=1 Tax=Bradyrhizobium sp. Gha TaxID=1855318 RepID=UPI0008E6D363|nr:hypothetical protein [Bradyrhizobium sp. Gha]SFK14782.1 hypothetical protein SAMN05216525_15634 [Bradyrhizobium sp. Gha]